MAEAVGKSVLPAVIIAISCAESGGRLEPCTRPVTHVPGADALREMPSRPVLHAWFRPLKKNPAGSRGGVKGYIGS
jgi:hypothetical protein